jgi:hypothetical protein
LKLLQLVSMVTRTQRLSCVLEQSYNRCLHTQLPGWPLDPSR